MKAKQGMERISVSVPNSFHAYLYGIGDCGIWGCSTGWHLGDSADSTEEGQVA